MTARTTYTPENRLCPHFEDVDEELMKRLFSKVAAVRSSDKDLFEFTHRRIQVYEYGTGEVIGEDEIYDEFDETRIGNFAVIVRGPTGTGKSELCWALSHRLRADDRPVLHIDKNVDLMSLMAEEIPAFYREHTGQEIAGAKELDRLRQDITEEKETVADYAVSKAIIDLRNSNATLKIDNRDQLKHFVGRKLQELVRKGEYDSNVDFVTANEIKQFPFLDIFPDQSQEKAATQLTDALWDAIRDEYESPSLDTLLERVGQAFEDTRPVIIFEDWSVTSLDAIRLRRYMERDNDQDNWDFIVAGTPDSFEELDFQTQTNEDRFQYYETTQEGEDQVLFLDEQTAVDFIRPYVGYIKSIDGSVAYERDDDNRVTAIRKPRSKSRCELCGFCDDEFRDLFPFNRIFVKRVFAGLPEDDKQPRQFVQTVFDILTEYYESEEDIFPPSSSNELSNLTNDIDLADTVYRHPELADLAEWYGTVDDEEVIVDRRFAVTFGLDETVDYAEYDVVADDTVLRIPAQTPGETGSSGTGTGTAGTGSGTGETGGTTKSKEEKKIEELRPKVPNWQDDPDDWSEVDVHVRKGLRDAIERLTDSFTMWDDGPLSYRVGSGNPFVLNDELDDPEQIRINQQDFVRSDLLELLEFGVMRSDDPRNADYAALLSQAGTQLTEYAKAWRTNITAHEVTSDQKIFSKGAGHSLDEIAYSGYALCVLLDDPWNPLTVERIATVYTGPDTPSLDSDLADGFDDQLDRSDTRAVHRLFDFVEDYEELFADEFAITENAVNRPHLSAYVDEVSPFTIIDSLAKTRIDRVSGKVKVNSTGNNLTDVLKALYSLGRALEELSSPNEAEEIAQQITTELEGVDMEFIEQTVTDIRETYGDMLSESQESLAKFANESQQDVDTMCDAADRYLYLSNSNKYLDREIARYIGFKLLENRTVDRFEAVHKFNISTSTDGHFGGEFLEVSNELF